MVKKNSIPDRWRSLKAIGQRVPGSRFIAFKVPLKGINNQRVTQTQKFTPKDLLTSIRSQNEELGLIIDLTNTERYYTTKDLPKSVQYVKLHTVGLKIPDDATIHQFKRVVWKFLAANSDNDKLIGVHCTTGINRTGYLICRYLIDVDEWVPLTALSAFGQARGHPIEGTVYIEDIVKGPPRSNIGIDLPPAIDEPREMDNDSDDMHRDRRSQQYSMRSLLELIPRNEYADFDARDPRPLPLMRARSDEYQDDSRHLFNPRPEFMNRRPPFGDMDDDIDLRMPSERRGIPPGMAELLKAPERLRRPADFNPDGRFQSGPENRRDLYGSEPRPLMDLRDGPHGIQHEQGGYNERMRVRPGPGQGFDEYDAPPSNRVPPFPPGRMNIAEYDVQEAARRGRSLINELDYLDRLRRQEFPSEENENDGFDPRDHEMMSGGPYNERMQPQNVRTQEGPMNDRMNARSAQLHNESLNEPRPLMDRWDVEDPVPERIHPRNPRFIEGPVNERFPQREAQGFRNPADQRMHLQDGRLMNGPMTERMQSRDAQFMEGPMNNRMYSGDPRQTEASGNNPTQTRVTRLMDIPMNQRLNPRDGQAMENSMNNRIPPRPLTRGMGTIMTPRDSRPMEGPLTTRMHPRTDRAIMEGTMNNQMYSREANERMPLRDTRPMEGPMNERMYQRDAPTMMQRPMNEQMHPQNTHTVERPMTESMYPQNEEYPINKQRGLMNVTRPFEGRKMNPSEDVFRATNRFAPYPALMKLGQPTGPPRLDNRDPHEMLPPSQDPKPFPRRSRFN
ncbi:uncharacterized protein LOC143769738 isoform X2 [Ranitomeya variabilis]|uniref:uncharacterized protein LOC143769738 isoform X2 n=1 Tax=Ranitomeya variabilis TaxID=490064 RepID=UPI0040565145